MIDATNLKRELFSRLLRKEGLSVASPIARRGEAGSHELSFAQRRLWFLDQFAPGNAAYNIPVAFRVTGKLDVAGLRRSINEVVKRHSILRTIFATEGSKPVQVVLPSLTIELPVIDLEVFDSVERNARSQKLMSEESLKPFDLADGPLLRGSLLRLDAEEHILLLTLHHIVTDGWSFNVLLRELSALYENETETLPELPVQYSDFASWEREHLKGHRLDSQLAY